MKKQIPRGDDDLICPLHKKPMVEVCHTCPWWQQIRGTNPNTGEELDRWECAVAILPLLMIETSKEVRQGAAATESFRNETAKANVPPRPYRRMRRGKCSFRRRLRDHRM